jgi:hypothetical protein
MPACYEVSSPLAFLFGERPEKAATFALVVLRSHFPNAKSTKKYAVQIFQRAISRSYAYLNLKRLIVSEQLTSLRRRSLLIG